MRASILKSDEYLAHTIAAYLRKLIFFWQKIAIQHTYLKITSDGFGAAPDYNMVDTVTVEAIAGGGRITGTQTNNGEASAWSQDILSTESFLVGDITYTAGNFVKAFDS